MRYYLLTVWCLLPLLLFAQSEEDNMVIDNQICTYTFKQQKYNVIVEEKQEITYSCFKNVTPVMFYRFYNLDSEITKIKVKGVKASAPRYETYTKENIFYDDTKVCYLNLNFSRKDETGTVTYEKRYTDLYKFSGVNVLENHFVRNKIVQIVVPRGLQLRIIENNFGKGIVKSKSVDPQSGDTLYRFRMHNLGAWKYEENMPDFMTTVPNIQIIRGQRTFEQMYRWCSMQARLANNDDAVVAALAKDITKDCQTDAEKINALLHWVQNNIRYVAIEYGIHGFKPDEAQGVIRKKYGDCKGMSNLLKCLLMAEGFDARLVWINTTDAGREWTLPIPSADHMICALKYEGTYHFLDPTVQFMPFGEIGYSVQGKMGMVEDGDTYQLIRTPSFPPSHNREQLVTNYVLDRGRLVGQSALSFRGESRYEMAYAIQYTDKADVDRHLRSYLVRNNPADSVTDVRASGVTADSKELLIAYKETRPSCVQSWNDELYLSLDVFKDLGSLTIDTLKRKNDWVFPYSQNYVRIVNLVVPKGYGVKEVPPNVTIETKNYQFSIRYDVQKDTIAYRKELIIQDPYLSKSDFGEWNAAVSRLKNAYLKQITLKKN